MKYRTKKIHTFLFFLFGSQIFTSCNSYVNLDFVDRKLIKKIPDEKYLQINKPEKENSKVSEERKNYVSDEIKFKTDFYVNKERINTHEEEIEINWVATNKIKNQFAKPVLKKIKEFPPEKFEEVYIKKQKNKKEDKKVKTMDTPPLWIIWVIVGFLTVCTILFELIVYFFMPGTNPFNVLIGLSSPETGFPSINNLLSILVFILLISALLVFLFL